MTVKQNTSMFGLLEIENARNLTMQQLSETFIPTTLYMQLLSRKNHILFGARGQGKTALFRMLSFPGMRTLAKKYPSIGRIVSEKKIFGIYLPTKIEWIQSLSSQLGNHGIDLRMAFLWKLNLSSCVAFLETVKASLEAYCTKDDRIYVERTFCKKISHEWKLPMDCHTVSEVLEMLETIGYEWQTMLALCKIEERSSWKRKAKHSKTFAVFANEAFLPLQRGIGMLSSLLGIRKSASWFLCIDEAEYMVPEHQIVINAFMRGAPGNLFVKIATLPFSYYTLETGIAGAPVVAGHDFEYMHMENGGSEIIDEAKAQTGCRNDGGDREFVFCEMLFKKVVKEFFCDFDCKDDLLSEFLGDSKLLDADKEATWTNDSPYMSLLKKFAHPRFYARAKALFDQNGRTKFMNEVGRKVRGTLMLREAYSRRGGHKKSSLYSGAKMIVKCADGNPRLLISLLKSLMSRSVCSGKGERYVLPTKQEEILVAIANNFLNQLRSYQNVGPDLYKMVKKVGEYMKYELYSRPLTGDVWLSFAVEDGAVDGDLCKREMLKAAIAYGVIKPNDLTKINYGDESCLAGGYHLAYLFCPLFRLQPRKGRTLDLVKILKAQERHLEGTQISKQLFFDF